MTTPVNQGQYTFTGTLPSATDATYAGDTTYNLADPYIRALTEFLFNQGYSFSSKPPPIEAITTQVAPFNPLEQAALDMTAQGVGAYLPYFQRGMEAYEGALPFLGEGASVMRDAYPLYSEGVMGLRDAAMLARSGLAPTERGIYEGINMLQAGLGSFTPDAANFYMNPYMETVVEDQLGDIDEFYDNKITELNVKAANSGLRGSTRAAMIELEMERQRQDARQNVINQGLASAFNQAQNQFNIEQQALRAGAPTMANLGQAFGKTRSGLAALLSNLSTGVGNLGTNYTNLGQGLGNFAPTMANIGGAFNKYGNNLQGLQFNDINALTSAGQRARAFEQAVYDTQRANAMSIYMDPLNRTIYQQGFLGMSPNTVSYNMLQQPALSPMQQTFGNPAYTSQFPTGQTSGGEGGLFSNAYNYFFG